MCIACVDCMFALKCICDVCDSVLLCMFVYMYCVCVFMYCVCVVCDVCVVGVVYVLCVCFGMFDCV